MAGGWTLAVDIGTTSVTAAVTDGGRTELVEFKGGWQLPPAVSWPPAGPPSAGREAAGKAREGPDLVVLSLKRALAEASEITIAGRDVPPSGLYAAILGEVSRQASRGREPAAPGRLILTYPAALPARDAQAVFTVAAREAGLPAPELVAEPVAAAGRLAADSTAGQYVAILDAGGGSIDAAVLRRTAGGFEFAGPPGSLARTAGDDPAAALRQGIYELLATIASAGLTPSQLAAIHVTGQASRLPQTAALISEITGIRPLLASSPATATVLGAAAAGQSAASAAPAADRIRMRDAAREGIRAATETRAGKIAATAAGVAAAGVILAVAIPALSSTHRARPAAASSHLPAQLSPRAVAPRVSAKTRPADAASPVPGGPRPSAAASRITAIPPPEATSHIPADLYVAAETDGGTVTPVSFATGSAGRPIAIGEGAGPIAVSPDGKIAYAISSTATGKSTVVPVNLIAGTAGTPILTGSTGYRPDVAIAPDGKTAYVTTNSPSGRSMMLSIDIATGKIGARIDIGGGGYWNDIAITPSGATAYVTGDSSAAGTVVPVNLATSTAGTPIRVGGNGYGASIAVAPDGKTAYVTTNSSASKAAVVPISLATGKYYSRCFSVCDRAATQRGRWFLE